MEGTVVVDFADDVDGISRGTFIGDVLAGICGDMYRGCRLVRLVDGHFRLAYLRLLPPAEGEAVAVRVA